jgi:hypothetical protein
MIRVIAVSLAVCLVLPEKEYILPFSAISKLHLCNYTDGSWYRKLISLGLDLFERTNSLSPGGPAAENH